MLKNVAIIAAVFGTYTHVNHYFTAFAFLFATFYVFTFLLHVHTKKGTRLMFDIEKVEQYSACEYTRFELLLLL